MAVGCGGTHLTRVNRFRSDNGEVFWQDEIHDCADANCPVGSVIHLTRYPDSEAYGGWHVRGEAEPFREDQDDIGIALDPPRVVTFYPGRALSTEGGR